METSENPEDFAPFDRNRLNRRSRSRRMGGALTLVLGVSAGVSMLDVRSTDEDAASVRPVAVIVPAPYNALLDATFSLGLAPVSLAESAPRSRNFVPSAPALVASVEQPDESPTIPMAPPVVPPLVVPPLVADVPLPVPRPPDMNASSVASAPFRTASRQAARPIRTSQLPATPPDNRTFLQKLFGMPAPSGPVLAYATPEDGIFGNARRFTASPALPYDRWTAVYDIEAHTVYMPNGSKLEAHSGLGDRLDDPRHVADRNVGPTPPHVYDLQPREQLFHGVRALRLNPVGGGGVFGRTGLLAHSYMLGPNGDSNGCVSFRNYDAFLQAFLNGEVRHLAVVPRLI